MRKLFSIFFFFSLCFSIFAQTIEVWQNGHATVFSYADSVVYKSSSMNAHEYVDLGLPSGLLWATCNVGANSPEEYGDYYAWGEVVTRTKYNTTTYRWYIDNQYTKYNETDGLTTLEPEDDVAHVIWGGEWRMPTYWEAKELKDNCIWESTEYNGVKGIKATSKINNNWIFLPAGGYNQSIHVELAGHYWTSTLSEYIYSAMYLKFDYGYSSASLASYARYEGRSIRPVCTK